MVGIYKLKDLIEVRSAITTICDGNMSCRVLSVRSINETEIDYIIFDSAYATTKPKPLQIGDVLVVNRSRFSVALVGIDLPKYEVTTPSFVFNLRIIKKDKILPEYLYYYLNIVKTQNKMKSLQQGGTISFISKKDLFDMNIELFAIKQQQKIAELYYNIMFIDGSREFDDLGKQNQLTPEHINKIYATYKNRTELEKYSRSVLITEIVENEYNLNIPRYVDTFEADIDLTAVSTELKNIDTEIQKVNQEIAKYSDELAIEKSF